MSLPPEEGALLHVDSGASRAPHSISRQLTSLFAGTWRLLHGTAGYRYRDVAADPVPPIGTAYTALGRRVERSGAVARQEVRSFAANAAEEAEWALTLPLVEEVLAADTLLLSVPMYNFSVPAALKAWIDRITFPGAFTDPVTGAALLRGTRVVVCSARGGAYGPGTPREGFDFQEPYLRAYFTNLGVADADLCFVHAELTVAGVVPRLSGLEDAAARSLAAAREEVVALAGGAVARA